MKYGQFCPIAKASELLGEKWTFLILRELIMGGRRFNELQRGLGNISPTMLTIRLHQLEEEGVVIRKKIHSQRGHEYYLTEAGKEVLPIIHELGSWGMKWARGQMQDTDLDIELLMLYLVRSIKPEKLISKETVLHFRFTDLKKLQDWWIVIKGNDIDTCLEDPGKETDIWLTTDLRTMIEVWMGDKTYKSAIRENKLKLVGPSSLIKNVTRWMANSDFAGMRSANRIKV